MPLAYSQIIIIESQEFTFRNTLKPPHTMELFLLVSMALTIVTFSLIVLSEPITPSIAENDGEFAADFLLEDNRAERRDAVVNTLNETTVPQATAVAI
ncbi:MAG: hypothetical protein ACI8YQ_002905 [Polaribacter sp.]|jgi:hypothetical protein